jgi:hypothetical protein
MTTLTFPNLTAPEAAALNAALAAAQLGATVTVALTYTKCTKSEPRIAGKDYRPLLGAANTTLIGTVKKVAVGKNGPYVLLDATITRAPLNGEGAVATERLGWTSIKPEGVQAAQVLAVVAAKAKTEHATA